MKAFNPVPKPVNTKKAKPPCNGYKDKANRFCFYDGECNAERHEIFGGSNRKYSIEDKFQIDVCTRHHKELQDNITEWAQNENRKWREHFQKSYEVKKMKEEGMTHLQARIAFRARYGKNYLPLLKEEM